MTVPALATAHNRDDLFEAYACFSLLDRCERPSGVLTASEAGHPGTFFQQIESIACPPRTFQYHGQGEWFGDLTDSSGVLIRRDTAAVQGCVAEGSSVG